MKTLLSYIKIILATVAFTLLLVFYLAEKNIEEEVGASSHIDNPLSERAELDQIVVRINQNSKALAIMESQRRSQEIMLEVFDAPWKFWMTATVAFLIILIDFILLT